MKIYIDASCDILYSSYYIQGLYSVFGRKNVKFSSRYFKSFKHSNHFFAFVVDNLGQTQNIIIDFTDSKIIDETALQWSDVYGKINFDSTINTSNKIIAIGPSFGIQIYSLCDTLKFTILNLFQAYSRIPNKRKFLSDYKAQFKRPKYSEYQNAPSKPNSIFFMASLWKQEQATNLFRANYIKSCRDNPTITFEGGFAPRTRSDIQGFEDLTVTNRVAMSYYLEHIKTSAVVFNTPAVKSCHGWKLAEYLCLGKAILSTPLSRDLPEAFHDGMELLYTNGSIADISKKLNAIISDPILKQSLETQSKSYFDNYLSPESVIKRLVKS